MSHVASRFCWSRFFHASPTTFLPLEELKSRKLKVDCPWIFGGTYFGCTWARAWYEIATNVGHIHVYPPIVYRVLVTLNWSILEFLRLLCCFSIPVKYFFVTSENSLICLMSTVPKCINIVFQAYVFLQLTHLPIDIVFSIIFLSLPSSHSTSGISTLAIVFHIVILHGALLNP